MRSMKIVAVVAIVALCAVLPSAWAEVADSSANGFTVKVTSQLQAAPADVYARIIKVGEWWDSSHTYSQDGCFCEKLPNGGGVQHMEVVLVIPGKLLRLRGGLGPLQGMATAGSMTFTLTPATGGTKLDLTYAVVGYSAQGLTSIAPAVDHVLSDQIARLKTYVEKSGKSQ
jgi:hypothetical protein